jgi:tetratricopeptide (TPR) repeat protein
MSRFEEPQKEDVKLRESAPQFRADESTSISRLATEPAQLAITRPQAAEHSSTPVEREPDGGILADLLSPLRPLLWLLLFLALPWVVGAMVDWTGAERNRSWHETENALEANRLEDAEQWTIAGLQAIPEGATDTFNLHRRFWSQTRLGHIHSLMGKYGQACVDYGTAYKYGHNNSADLAWLLPQYGAALNSNGRADQAVKMEEEALKIPKTDDSDLQFTWRELASAYNNVGRYDDALKATNKAWASTDNSNDRIRIDIVAGDALDALGRNQDAMSRYKTAADSGINRSGPYVSEILRGGGVYLTGLSDRRRDNAKSWLDDSLKMAKKYPTARYDQSAVLNDLANWYVIENNPALAISSLEQAKSFDLKKSDPDNLDYARDLYNVALVKSSIGNAAGAKVDLTKCIEIRRKLLGANNPLTQKAIKASNGL